MRHFHCPHCEHALTFDNSVCLSCNSPVGILLANREFVVTDNEYRLCANSSVAECNWTVSATAPAGALCESCQLTRTRPMDGDPALEAFAAAEHAKRRMLYELAELGLPVTTIAEDREYGLRFDLLSSGQEPVTTGHFNGVISLDLAEGDDVHRERLRVSMAEPYRTLLGHFRHEIGHYFYWVLIGGAYLPADTDVTGRDARFAELFGDAMTDYQEAADRHYSDGPPADWESEYVSSYATMHPHEDWAETFAHYLHIRDTLDTAAAFEMAPTEALFTTQALSAPDDLPAIIHLWLPLSWQLNMINRSMGYDDLYPFVLAPRVLEKMAFVHQMVVESAQVTAVSGPPISAPGRVSQESRR